MLKKAIKILKEYLSVIAITPLILGGFWQVFSLASMSPSYIRFFSVSQQIADGLLILFVAFTLSLLYFILVKFVLSAGTDRIIDRLNSFTELSYKTLVLRFVFSTVVVMLSLLIFLKQFLGMSKVIIKEYSDVLGFIINLSMILLFTVLVLFYPLMIINKKFEIFKLKYNSENFVLFKVVVTAFIIMWLFVKTIELAVGFHNLFTFPSNLKNRDFVMNRYLSERKYVGSDSISIVYWNDKYIFIKDSSKIEVVKFDYMFSE